MAQRAGQAPVAAGRRGCHHAQHAGAAPHDTVMLSPFGLAHNSCMPMVSRIPKASQLVPIKSKLLVLTVFPCRRQEHEAHEEADLVAFWQAAPGGGGNIESGVATPKQVWLPSVAVLVSLMQVLVPVSRFTPGGYHAPADGNPNVRGCLRSTSMHGRGGPPAVGGLSVCVNPIPIVSANPMQVFAQLANEGFQLSAARVPLSRERVPEAADLDTLRAVHTPPPEGAVQQCVVRTLPSILGCRQVYRPAVHIAQ